MTFWLIAALMTFAAALFVLRPFMRNSFSNKIQASDIDVYRDQLGEVERERASGLIGEAEAQEATLEIKRRILASDRAGISADKTATGVSRLTALLAVLALLLISWGGYHYYGSPDRPDQSLASRMNGPVNPDDVPAMIARIETHVAQSPDDARGWQVLGPIYLRTGRFDDAVRAFGEVIRIEGESAPLLIALAEAQMMRDEGRVEDETMANAQKALELDPRMPKSRFILALAMIQNERFDAARDMLEQIRDSEPEGSQWHQGALQALTDLEQRQRAATQAPALSSEQAGAIAALPQAEQAQAIAGMVDGLANRLRDNPRDVEGWQRLIRAYTVLGRNDEAKQALDTGVETFGQDSSEAASLRRFARETATGNVAGE